MKKLFLTLTLVLFVIPFVMSQELSPYVPTDGLVAYYPFNGNANDASGNGNHGTVIGATLTSDRDGNENSAYDFNGDNSIINLPELDSNIGTPGVITSYSMWFKGSAPQDGNGLGAGNIFHAFVPENGDYYIRFEVARSTENPNLFLKVYYRNPNDNNEPSKELIDYSTQTWHNITVVADGISGLYNYYFNGVNLPEMSFSFNPNNDYSNPNRVWQIGRINPAPNSLPHAFLGQIDDIGIWNRALTEQKIQNLYNSSTGDIILNGVVSAENNQIKNIADPTDHKDAVTKSYLQAKIDELILRIENIENGVIPDSPVVFSLGIDSVSGYSTPGNTVTAYAINGDILGTAIAQIESFSNYMILDDFTDRVPTGTNYEKLTYYDTYTDAGSIDGSRFEINRLTTDYGGGILFYGTLELNSQDDKNVFRLSDSDGLPFKFNSFYLDQLESNGTYNFTEFSGTADPGQTVEIYIGGNLFNSTVSDENGEWSIPFDNIPEGSNSIEIIGGVHYGPSLKVTFDNSHEVIFRKELSSIFSFDGDTNLEFFEGFDTSGTKSFNIDKVEWVDFESHYTKAKITDINLDQIDSNFDVSFAPQQTSGSSVLLSSTDEYGTESDKVGVTID